MDGITTYHWRGRKNDDVFGPIVSSPTTTISRGNDIAVLAHYDDRTLPLMTLSCDDVKDNEEDETTMRLIDDEFAATATVKLIESPIRVGHIMNHDYALKEKKSSLSVIQL